MKVLNIQETTLVSGGNEEALFNGLVFGATAGFFIGTYAGARVVSKYPLLAIMPGVFENAITLGACCGACIGGFVGGFTAVLMDDSN